MAEGQEPEKAKDGESQGAGYLKMAAGKLVPLLVSAVVSVGFVAFAGKAVLWTRFSALQVPSDQVVKAVPQSEAVAIGASMLLIFGALGALAALGIYLIDQGGRATAQMSRGVLMLVGAEAAVAIWFTEGKPLTSKIVATEVVVLAVGAVLWATYVAGLTRAAMVPTLKKGEREPERPLGPFFETVTDGCGTRVTNRMTKKGLAYVGLIAIGLAVAGYLVALAIRPASGWRWVVALGLLGAVFLCAVLWHCHRFWRLKRATDTEKEKAGEVEEPPEPPEKDAGGGGDGAESEAGAKPLGAELAGWGIVFTLVFAALVVAIPSWVLHEWWLAVSLGVVVLIGSALWRIASLGKKRFIWYGLAVFISVPLFGTVMMMARNIDEPQVQPMALIRSTDGPDESIQGLYVTETSDRVYFANVATEGCGKKVTPHSGRLLWVPKDEVVAMSLGPLQSVEDASRTALEMSYDLTPAVETGGATISLAGEAGEEAEQASGHNDTRLENVGPAVRPDFGTGLRIEPEMLAPGEEATLRMSQPNEEVEGFGPSRKGHNLRLGGKLLDISKETSGVAGAEYIEAKSGRLIDLGKEGVYFKEEGQLVPAEEVNDGDADDEVEGVYVRLDDPAILEVDDEPVGEEPTYVRVKEAGGAGRVAKSAQTVTLAGGTFEGRSWDSESVQLKGLPLRRQAWHRDRIRFHVPEDAKSGVVTVECDQLAGAALLQVSHAPHARIAVHTRPKTLRIVFDSSASTSELPASTPSASPESDDSATGDASGDSGSGGEAKKEEALTRRWKVDGVLVNHGKRIKERMAPRIAPYTIELTVTDKDGNSDTAKLEVLRLPAAELRSKPGKASQSKTKVRDALEAVRRALEKAAEAERPKGVEMDAYTNSPGKPARNVQASLKKDDAMRESLLRDSKKAAKGEGAVTVEELAHGESCPLHPAATPANLHLDVFLLHEGVVVKPAKGCRALEQKRATWLPPPGKASG
jgi:hypothetical protein